MSSNSYPFSISTLYTGLQAGVITPFQKDESDGVDEQIVTSIKSVKHNPSMCQKYQFLEVYK